MANKTLNVTLIMRNDTAATWKTKNPVLKLGEMGIETDTRKFKIGDGTTNYNSLKYASGGEVNIADSAPEQTDKDYDVGTIWIDQTTNKVYIYTSLGTAGSTTFANWVQLLNENSTINKATKADKLSTARTIKLQGAVDTVSDTFDGSKDVEFNLVLKDSGVEAGTYTKLTVNSKGIITSATQLTAADIPSLTLSKISNAGSAAAKNVGTVAGNVPVLNANGKLDDSILPALAITETFVVDSQAAMLALTAQRGDVAIRTDENSSYILKEDDPTQAANWVVLRTPDCKVLSVNGKTGAITLSTSDIDEGTNLYFTTARATENFNTNFAAKSVTGLKDGADVVLSTDTLTINGGKA